MVVGYTRFTFDKEPPDPVVLQLQSCYYIVVVAGHVYFAPANSAAPIDVYLVRNP